MQFHRFIATLCALLIAVHTLSWNEKALAGLKTAGTEKGSVGATTGNIKRLSIQELRIGNSIQVVETLLKENGLTFETDDYTHSKYVRVDQEIDVFGHLCTVALWFDSNNTLTSIDTYWYDEEVTFESMCKLLINRFGAPDKINLPEYTDRFSGDDTIEFDLPTSVTWENSSVCYVLYDSAHFNVDIDFEEEKYVVDGDISHMFGLEIRNEEP